MNVIRPEVHVKRLPGLFSVLNKLDRALDKRTGDLGSIQPFDITAVELVAAKGVLLRWLSVKGIQEWKDAIAKSFELGERLIETVFGNERRVADISLAAHVPLAEMTSG